MIEQKTILDKIEIDRDGHMSIRFGLLVIEDGAEIACQWHRTAIEPGGDAEAQLAAVNAHLRSMGRPTVAADKVALLKDVLSLVHTPDVVASFRASEKRRR